MGKGNGKPKIDLMEADCAVQGVRASALPLTTKSGRWYYDFFSGYTLYMVVTWENPND